MLSDCNVFCSHICQLIEVFDVGNFKAACQIIDLKINATNLHAVYRVR